MADRQWFSEGVQIFETGTEEYFSEGVQFVEDQATVSAGLVTPYYYTELLSGNN